MPSLLQRRNFTAFSLSFIDSTPQNVILLLSLLLLMQNICAQENYLDPTVSTSTEDLFKGAPPIQYSTLSGPSFNYNTSTNHATVVAGSTAMLTCAIRNLHNFTVSWVRSRDTRLLTTSTITYTSDKRFVASDHQGSTQWILRIHYARLQDSGLYLCQVSTTPPIMLSVNLTVVEALIRISPGREVHVQLGSQLELVCEVEGCRDSPLLSWTRGGQTVNDAELLPSIEISSTGPISRLILSHAHATPHHSGMYSCSSSCTQQPVNVTVHVLKGEELAAMQHHNGDVKLLGSYISLSLSLLLLFLEGSCNNVSGEVIRRSKGKAQRYTLIDSLQT